jgi:AmiR/NasT family two-component response regulator
MAHNDRSAPRAEVPSGTTEPNLPRAVMDTVIVGGNDETRLLLRGLLRLHRYRVRGESRTADGLDPVEEAPGPRILVLVEDGEGPDWTDELVSARARQTGLLPLLIVPETSPDLVARARAAGVLAVLPRPFAIRDFIATVEAVSRGEERFPPAGGQP